MKSNKADSKKEDEFAKQTNDIVHTHLLIQKYYKEEISRLPLYQEQLFNKIIEFFSFDPPYGAKEILQTSIISICNKHKKQYNLSKHVKVNLRSYKTIYSEIIELDQRCELLLSQQGLYNSIADPIIERYKMAILTPTKSNFISNRSQCNDTVEQREIEDIIADYRQILDNCFDQEFINKVFPLNVRGTTIDTMFIKDEEIDTSCNNNDDESCLSNIKTMIYDDLSRINFAQKYKYDKKLHFKDIILQYQGLQTKNIPQKVYDDIDDMIKKHNLVKENITKEHLRGFLIECGHNKYYEDLHLIYHKITAKPLPNIQKYEKKLYEDFDLLVDTFLKLDNLNKNNRKNFLSGHYVLKQLLKRHNYQVPEGDLNTLKTLSRTREHDEIYQRCCDILSWSFSPMC
jgi:hypothetical protein